MIRTPEQQQDIIDWFAGFRHGSGHELDVIEVHFAGGRRVTPAGSGAWNPAFDVTPADLVTAIVTDERVIRPALGERP